MNSLVAKFAFGATLASASLIAFAQTPAGTPARVDMTLLTGPRLLSPASRPLESQFISSEKIASPQSGTTSALEQAQHRRAATEARLQKLRAERAALKESKEMGLSTKPADVSGQSSPAVPLTDSFQFEALPPPKQRPESLKFDSTLDLQSPSLQLKTTPEEKPPGAFRFQRHAP